MNKDYKNDLIKEYNKLKNYPLGIIVHNDNGLEVLDILKDELLWTYNEIKKLDPNFER